MSKPKAYSWTERVVYVECPECREVEEIGSGVIWSDPATWWCSKCNKEFEVEDVIDD